MQPGNCFLWMFRRSIPSLFQCFRQHRLKSYCCRGGDPLIVLLHRFFLAFQMHQTGYKFSRSHRVLTLFTASDYLKSQNTGAVLTLDPNVSFQPTRLQRSFSLPSSSHCFDQCLRNAIIVVITAIRNRVLLAKIIHWNWHVVACVQNKLVHVFAPFHSVSSASFSFKWPLRPMTPIGSLSDGYLFHGGHWKRKRITHRYLRLHSIWMTDDCVCPTTT